MKVSVVVIVKNESKYIKDCISAILNQSYTDFEIIAVDNGSTDGTSQIIQSFDDKRIKYIYEPSNCGVAVLRNIGARKANGAFVFFTDGDCRPNKYWLEEGLYAFEKKACVGVEGITFYQSQQKRTISDYDTFQYIPGEYMTCNIAYTNEVLEKVNYFDPAFRISTEDRDLAFRVMQHGHIHFSPDMIVAHQKKKLTIKSLFLKAKRAEDKVYFIKKHGWYEHNKHGQERKASIRILYLEKFIFLLFPPLLLFTERYASINDIVLGIFFYISLIYERLVIWKSAFKYRVFVL